MYVTNCFVHLPGNTAVVTKCVNKINSEVAGKHSNVKKLSGGMK